MNIIESKITTGVLLMFLIGLLFFPVSIANKKAEIINREYGMDCSWYNVSACSELLQYKEGLDYDINFNKGK